MFFYLGLVSVMFFLFVMADISQYSKLQRKILLVCPAILLFIVSIFRFDVGYDYFSYYNLVRHVTDEGVERFEPISYCFVQLARFWEQPYILFILFGIPTYLPVFWFCKRTKHFQLAFWIYVFLFWLNTFGIIRQAAAMGIILMALQCMFDRKLFLYVLWCIFASMFHMTAFLMIPVYFIYHYCTWKVVILGMIILVVCFQVVVSILIDNNIYATYLLKDEEYEGGTIVRFFLIGICMLLWRISIKKKLSENIQKAFSAMIPAYFFPFILNSAIGGRISSYFYLFLLYLFPVILSHCSKKIRMVIMLFLCAYFFALLYVSAQNPIRSPNIPYQHIFEVDLDHPKFR